MREHPINQQNNFIMGWYADDTKFCDNLIRIFNSNESVVDGFVGSYGYVDKNIKESRDLHFNSESLNNLNYGNIVKTCTKLYFEKYDRAICTGVYPVEGFNVQHYNIGGGFKQWHDERQSADYPSVARHLVFMTYLNDVDDGGTEFLHQNIKVKAEKGLTLVWPSDWTFTHKSEVSNTKEKWIATGWLHLLSVEEKKHNKFESRVEYENRSMQ
jgi:hypothetical protein